MGTVSKTMSQHTLFFTSIILLYTPNLVNSFLGKFLFSENSGCNCPCRTNYVMRCVQTYEEKCDYNQYDHSKHKCIKHPVFAIKNVTETECQICRNIWETEMIDVLKWTCDPVYDESCKTHYPQKCSYKKKCPHTCEDKDCSLDPYKAKFCKRIKYCSRKPHTTCTPVKRKECSMKKYLSPKKVKRNVCLPFENSGPKSEDCSIHQTYQIPQIPHFINSLHGYSGITPSQKLTEIPISSYRAYSGSNAITESYKHNDEYFPPSSSKDDDFINEDDDFTPSSVDEMFLPSHNDVSVAAFYT